MIGPKGNAINEILQDTGVFVEMPSSDSTSETITLRGPQEKLGLGEFTFKSCVSLFYSDVVEPLLQSGRLSFSFCFSFDKGLRKGKFGR